MTRPLFCCIGLCFLVLSALGQTKRAVRRPAAKPMTSAAATPSAVAQRWLKSLSLHDAVAQLVIMPFYGEPINARSRAFRQYQHLIQDVHVGGMIVLGHVIYGSVRNSEPYALASLVNRFQALAPLPLLIGGDFERGASMRVNGTTQWPHNMAFVAAGDVDASRLEGAATAREARALGVNWLFAPDADVNNNPDNPIINIRSYGEDPRVVAQHVRSYIQGAHSNPSQPVLVTAKHFPGHGDTAQDSHLALARLDASRERIMGTEMVPFQAAVDSGVDAVMTAHMAAPSLDASGVPATVSSAILTGLLRQSLNFRGIIVTDAMNMAGLAEMYKTGEAAVRCLEAGADVLLMPIRAEDAIAGVVGAVNSGRISRKRLDESVLKVLAAKAKLGLNRNRMADTEAIADVVDSPENEVVAQRVSDRAITLVRDEKDLLPVRNSANVSLLILTESRSGQQGRRLIEEVRKRAPDMRVTLLDPDMSKEDLDKVAKSTSGSSSILVVTYITVQDSRGDVGLSGEYPSLMNTLLSTGTPITLASFGSPYLVRSFPTVKAYLTTFSTTPTSEASLAKALFGEIPITGRLPVTIPGFAKIGDGIQLPASHQKGK